MLCAKITFIFATTAHFTDLITVTRQDASVIAQARPSVQRCLGIAGSSMWVTELILLPETGKVIRLGV